MRLMKYSFICPICERSYYTYVEQRHYQEMFNYKTPVEENFKNYPDCYQRIMETSICQSCQKDNSESICIPENSREDDRLYSIIEELDRKAI